MVFRGEGGFFSSQRRILIQHGKNSFVHFLICRGMRTGKGRPACSDFWGGGLRRMSSLNAFLGPLFCSAGDQFAFRR